MSAASHEPTHSAAWFRVGPAFAGFRLDQFLQRMIPKLSRNRIQLAIRARVRLSWEAPVKPSTPVRVGEIVYIDDPRLAEEERPFDPQVLYEDDDLLAIDKPAGWVVHPTHHYRSNTVISMLRRSRGEPALTLAHRLDAETTGVLLLGRHRWAARRLQTAFERGQVRKKYLALVAGRVERDRFTADWPLGPFSRDQFVFRQAPESSVAKPAETRFELVERRESSSLVLAEPVTGRRHQIRAHLALCGHPVLGDKLYTLDDGDYAAFLRTGRLDPALRAKLRADRSMLHSTLLALEHPRRREHEITIRAPAPKDFVDHFGGLPERVTR
ncbi:MAG: RluA family pseudouridine synthase [Acidobacteriota bacterium]|nr:MAG: RluA family pseudouridine synthase [Acidobacteriota bacterium]